MLCSSGLSWTHYVAHAGLESQRPSCLHLQSAGRAPPHLTPDVFQRLGYRRPRLLPSTRLLPCALPGSATLQAARVKTCIKRPSPCHVKEGQEGKWKPGRWGQRQYHSCYRRPSPQGDPAHSQNSVQGIHLFLHLAPGNTRTALMREVCACAGAAGTGKCARRNFLGRPGR